MRTIFPHVVVTTRRLESCVYSRRADANSSFWSRRGCFQRPSQRISTTSSEKVPNVATFYPRSARIPNAGFEEQTFEPNTRHVDDLLILGHLIHLLLLPKLPVRHLRGMLSGHSMATATDIEISEIVFNNIET